MNDGKWTSVKQIEQRVFGLKTVDVEDVFS